MGHRKPEKTRGSSTIREERHSRQLLPGGWIAEKDYDIRVSDRADHKGPRGVAQHWGNLVPRGRF